MKTVLAILLLGSALQEDVKILTADRVAQIELPYSKTCTNSPRDPISVSLVSLLANPERFEGKAVEVIGYYHHGRHPFHAYSAIFLHKEDYEQGIISNSIWVENPPNNTISNDYVVITGIFTTKINGDLGTWDSGLCNIDTFEIWRQKGKIYGPD